MRRPKTPRQYHALLVDVCSNVQRHRLPGMPNGDYTGLSIHRIEQPREACRAPDVSKATSTPCPPSMCWRTSSMDCSFGSRALAPKFAASSRRKAFGSAADAL